MRERSMPESPDRALRRFFDLGQDDVFYKGMSDLQSMATRFIRRSYLETLATLPRGQDVPDDAVVVNPGSPVFISHPWRNGTRPDDGILTAIRSFIPNDDRVGVWIDYCCLPQGRRDGVDDRTAADKELFKSQLQYIPTILLKSQMVVLWKAEHARRGWCVVELIVADILKNVIMKQIYHCQNKLSDPLLFITETYDPHELCVVGGVAGAPVTKILLPHAVKDLPVTFYNFVLHRLGMAPTLLTTLLRRVEPWLIDEFFAEQRLASTNARDIPLLKQLLLKVCRFAGDYDVTSIHWPGRIPCQHLLPYIFANVADFTVNLVGYEPA